MAVGPLVGIAPGQAGPARETLRNVTVTERYRTVTALVGRVIPAHELAPMRNTQASRR